MLRRLNGHPRDEHLVFDEGPHVYYIRGDSNNISVTTLVHRYFGQFDADAVIAKMMASPKWPKSKYFGMTGEAIKKQWSDAGLDASTKGTRMHKSIELFYNNLPTDDFEQDKEFQMFKHFHHVWKDLVPYRTEWEVYDEELRLAGSIDMVFKHNDELFIYDWKRSKEIKFTNRWERGLGPLQDYDDCNFVSYSLQLNIYRYILEKHYGLKIAGLFLVVIHPDFDHFKRIPCLELRDVVHQIMELRLEEVRKK